MAKAILVTSEHPVILALTSDEAQLLYTLVGKVDSPPGDADRIYEALGSALNAENGPYVWRNGRLERQL